jgi:catalase
MVIWSVTYLPLGETSSLNGFEKVLAIMEEEDQLRFGFDLLDPTKIVPEELVPVTILGKIPGGGGPR